MENEMNNFFENIAKVLKIFNKIILAGGGKTVVY